MSYFSPDFIEFFKELAANNNKDWFDVNRKRYENNVKKPFYRFVEDTISALKKEDSDFDLDLKRAVFRINRDIRFSKDKSPYKLHMATALINGGKKNMHTAGMYLQSSPENFRIYQGLYMPEKSRIYEVRERIAAQPRRWKKIISSAEFVENYGEVQGEKNKIIPKEFKSAAEKEPFIFNKQWYIYTDLAPETILREDILDFVMEKNRIARDFNAFLN
ncbi:MAG TPA: hypothetical protein DDX92_03525 [Flavobacteriales bacterium]|jgi:uncharacterized protein (TIGR02453 family)|nr:hypothetical protein [Flavobacteriales bacterium]